MIYADTVAGVCLAAGVTAEPLSLPLRGVTYAFPAMPLAAVSARLRLIEGQMEAGIPFTSTVGDLMPNDSRLIEGMLAGASPALDVSAITDRERDHLAVTLYLFYLRGTEAAEAYWSGGSPAIEKLIADARQAVAASTDRPTSTRKAE